MVCYTDPVIIPPMPKKPAPADPVAEQVEPTPFFYPTVGNGVTIVAASREEADRRVAELIATSH